LSWRTAPSSSTTTTPSSRASSTRRRSLVMAGSGVSGRNGHGAQFSGRLARGPRLDERVGPGTPGALRPRARARYAGRPMRTDLRADEALSIVLDAVAPLPAETCAAGDALGRVLAEPV